MVARSAPALPAPLLAARVFSAFVTEADAGSREALATLTAVRAVCVTWRRAADLALAALTRLAPRDARALTLPLGRWLPSLRTLVLSRCHRGGVPSLASGSLAHITTLDLSDCAWVTCDVLLTLAGRDGAATPLPALTSLDLSRCCNAELDAWDARAGRALRPLAPQLRSLSLECCAITPLSLLRIAPSLRSLLELNLAGCLLFHTIAFEHDNDVGDESVDVQRMHIYVALEAIAAHRRLQRLDLCANRILLRTDAHVMQLRAALLPLAGVLSVDVSECWLQEPDTLAVVGGFERPEDSFHLYGDWCDWTALMRVFACAVTELRLNNMYGDTDMLAFGLLGATRGFIFAQVQLGETLTEGMVMLPLARTACGGGLFSAWVQHGEKQDLKHTTQAVMTTLLRACAAFHDVDDDAPRKVVVWCSSEPYRNDLYNGPGALYEGRAYKWPYMSDKDATAQVPQLLEMVRNAERRLGSGACTYEEEETQAEAEAREEADLRQGTHAVRLHRLGQPPGVPVPGGAADGAPPGA